MPLAPGGGIGDGGDEEEIGKGAVADEMLVSRQAPAVSGAHGARLDPRRVRACAGLGDGYRSRALAAHGRLEPALDLLALAFEQHLIDVAEGAADEDVGRAAELLLREHVIDGREAPAAELRGNVHRIEPERLGLLVNRLGEFGPQRAGLFDLVLERLKLLGDEAADGFDEHALFVAEREIHGWVSQKVQASARRERASISRAQASGPALFMRCAWGISTLTGSSGGSAANRALRSMSPSPGGRRASRAV